MWFLFFFITILLIVFVFFLLPNIWFGFLKRPKGCISRRCLLVYASGLSLQIFKAALALAGVHGSLLPHTLRAWSVKSLVFSHCLTDLSGPRQYREFQDWRFLFSPWVLGLWTRAHVDCCCVWFSFFDQCKLKKEWEEKRVGFIKRPEQKCLIVLFSINAF